jgi:hypothetical protein
MRYRVCLNTMHSDEKGAKREGVDLDVVFFGGKVVYILYKKMPIKL